MRNVLHVRPLLTCLAACLMGCASSGLLHFAKHNFPKSSLQNPVLKIVGLWQPGEGIAGDRPARGFSGQVLFFTADNVPVQVDGEVMVYIFDDQGPEEEQVKPINEFIYPAESWNALLAKGSLGATYNVFIPYTRPGHHEANCTLRVRYSPKQGPTVYSEMIHIVLSGTKAKPDSAAAAEKAETAKASRETAPESAKRQSPSPQDIAASISFAQNLEVNRPRAQAEELTEEQRERILAEAKARLVAEKGRKVQLVGYEEANGSGEQKRPVQKRRRAPNPLATPDTNEDSGERGEPDEWRPRSMQTTIQKPIQSPKRHILDDEEPDEGEIAAEPVLSDDDGVE